MATGLALVRVAIIAVLGSAAPVLAAGGSEQVECQEVAATMPRIRTDDADIARAIARAIEWSETFRSLVEAIERTDGMVWIRQGPCNGAFACLSMSLEVSGPYRLLHIHVDLRRRLGDRLMESLGHELQHVVEVLRSSAKSSAGMYYFFLHNAYRIGGRFETRAAEQAGIAVSKEVALARKQQPGASQARQP